MALNLRTLGTLDPELQLLAIRKRLEAARKDPAVREEVRRAAQVLGLWSTLVSDAPDIFQDAPPVPGPTPNIQKPVAVMVIAPPKIVEVKEHLGEQVVVRVRGGFGRAPGIIAGKLQEIRERKDSDEGPIATLVFSDLDPDAAGRALRHGEEVHLFADGLAEFPIWSDGSIQSIHSPHQEDPTLAPSVEVGTSRRIGQLARDWEDGRTIPETALPPEAFVGHVLRLIPGTNEYGPQEPAAPVVPEKEIESTIERNAITAVLIKEIFSRAFVPGEVAKLSEETRAVPAEERTAQRLTQILSDHLDRHINVACTGWANTDPSGLEPDRHAPAYRRASFLLKATRIDPVPLSEIIQSGKTVGLALFGAMADAVKSEGRAEHLEVLGRSMGTVREMAAADIQVLGVILPSITNFAEAVQGNLIGHLSFNSGVLSLSGKAGSEKLTFAPELKEKFKRDHGLWFDTKQNRTTGCPARIAFGAGATAIDKLFGAYSEMVKAASAADAKVRETELIPTS